MAKTRQKYYDKIDLGEIMAFLKNMKEQQDQKFDKQERKRQEEKEEQEIRRRQEEERHRQEEKEELLQHLLEQERRKEEENKLLRNLEQTLICEKIDKVREEVIEVNETVEIIAEEVKEAKKEVRIVSEEFQTQISEKVEEVVNKKISTEITKIQEKLRLVNFPNNTTFDWRLDCQVIQRSEEEVNACTLAYQEKTEDLFWTLILPSMV